MAVDLEVPLHQLMEASVAPLLQLLTVELLLTAAVEDMAVVVTEIHQEVAAANPGGKIDPHRRFVPFRSSFDSGT
ncbi:hypothetical protein JKG47_23985, partial [Acidithiobacillus sp. MC6.1]|nr:hypothetical protein [Acidithiobacillus sp. MC6.1]